MNPEQENFESLRRLLALKRHEQPPPGYFRDFSRQVIIRIEAGETPDESAFLEGLLQRAPWLRHLWTGVSAKPVLAGAFGMAVCGLLVSGIVYSEHDPIPLAVYPVTEGDQVGLARFGAPPANPLFRQAAAVSSTGAILPVGSGSSLFEQFKTRGAVEPASRTVTVPVGN